MTRLEKILETTGSTPSNINGLRGESVCSKGRASAIGGLGLAVAAPFLLPIAIGIAALAAASTAVAAWLKGRADAGSKAMLKVGGGGGNRPLTGVGSGFPPKFPQKIFGDLPHWRLF